MTESADPLTRAIELSIEFESLGGSKSVEDFLREHESLREILEPLLEPDATPDSRRILGDFELLRELGRGGMGVVYEAVQILLGRTVALKLLPPHRALSPRSLAMFRREATLAASLDHPGIAKVLEFQEVDGQLALAMELINGVPLDAVLAPFERRDPGELSASDLATSAKVDIDDATTPDTFSGNYVIAVTELAQQLAEALSHAHGRGIIHRDVKPGNILITPNGRAVLTDFGLAREEGMLGMTRTGEFAGTYQYAAPEQLEGRIHEIDGRTDVYALGATLYEMLTLRRPHEADSLAELVLRIKREEPVAPSKRNPQISADLESVVLCALEKERHRRYASAAEFATDLQHVLLNTPVRARRLSTSLRATRWVKRNRMVSGFVAVLVAAIALVSVFAANTAAFAANTAAAREREYTHRKRYQNMWVGASIDVVTRRARRAFPTGPSQIGELRYLVQTIEEDLLPQRQEQLDALAHLRHGHTSESPQPRSPNRPLHAASDRIRELQATIRRLNRECSTLPESYPARQDAEREVVAMQREVERLTASVDTSNRVLITDRKDSALHDRLEDQLFRLRELEATLLPDLRYRLDWARRVEAETLSENRAAWDAVARRLAKDGRFGGLTLRPQLGLLPLGQDPDSGLEEFGHPISGVVPTRDAEGQLQLAAGHSMVFVLMPGDQFTTTLTRRLITIEAFMLSKFEMNRRQWQHLARDLPGLRWRDGGIADVRNHGQLDKPVNSISWNMCRRLLARYGLDMPSVGEWEYAATFGGSVVLADLHRYANVRDQSLAQGRPRIDPKSCYDFEDGYVGLAPSVSMAAHPASGLHHMLGNVSEFCKDRHMGLNTCLVGGGHFLVKSALMLNDRYAPDASARSVGLRPARRLL